jgi:methyl-accepting chemotaxis protein
MSKAGLFSGRRRREEVLGSVQRPRPAVSLSRKMIGAFVVVSLLVGAVSMLSVTYLQRIDGSYSELLSGHAAVVLEASEIRGQTQLQNGLLFAYIVDPSADKQKQLEEANRKLADMVKGLAARLSSEESLQAVAKMDEGNTTFARLLQKVVDYVNRGQAGLAKTEAMTWAVPATDTLIAAADTLEQTEKAAMAAGTETNRRLVQNTTRTLIAVSVAAFVLALAVGIALSRLVVRPMRGLAATAGRIAACDLTAADVIVRNRDEIREVAEAFNRMKENLRNVIGRVGISTGRVAETARTLSDHASGLRESAERIAAVVQQISAGADTQASGAQASVGEMDGMSEAAREIAGAAATAQGTSAEALEAASAGQAAVEATVAQMGVIHGQMRQLAERVQRLGEHSQRIGQAVGLITEIARQTNLLALNASIEAARAGPAGRGFAVVAEEVRKLSQQTEHAAAEVAGWAGDLQDETGRVADSTEAGVKEVATGIEVVRRAGAAFERTLGAVHEAASQFAAVSERTDRIVRRTESASAAIRAIDEVAAQTAAGARDVSGEVVSQAERMDDIVRAAAGLAAMAEELGGLLAQFKL